MGPIRTLLCRAAAAAMLLSCTSTAPAQEEVAKLAPADGHDGDAFGDCVSLSGTRALVGNRYRDDRGPETGTAYVFESIGGKRPCPQIPRTSRACRVSWCSGNDESPLIPDSDLRIAAQAQLTRGSSGLPELMSVTSQR